MNGVVPRLVAVSFLIAGAYPASAQESRPLASAATSHASARALDARKIANALSAGPKYVTDHAAVLDWPSPQDKEQTMRVLREGSNGWTCLPDQPGLPRHSPMCADQTTMKWMMAIMAGKDPNIDRVGVSYMLQGEAGSDIQNITAKAPPAGKDWYYAGPHVMVVLPDGAKSALKDVGQDTSTGLPYVRAPDSVSPLLVIPVAKSDEKIIISKTNPAK